MEARAIHYNQWDERFIRVRHDNTLSYVYDLWESANLASLPQEPWIGAYKNRHGPIERREAEGSTVCEQKNP